MKKILILYHSGVGNTKLISDLYTDYLKGMGIPNIDSKSVEKADNIKILNEYDLILFGFPTYHEKPSKTMYNFIKNIPPFLGPKYYAAFTTCGLYSGNSLRIFEKICSDKNLVLLYSKSYRTAATDGVLLAPGIPFFYSFEKEIVKKIKKDICKILSAYQRRGTESDRPRFKLYSLLNYPNKKMGELYKPNIYPNHKLCVKCSLCVNHCYYNCLIFDEKNKLLFLGEECEHCYRCIHLCPKKALSLKKKSGTKNQLNHLFFSKIRNQLEKDL